MDITVQEHAENAFKEHYIQNVHLNVDVIYHVDMSVNRNALRNVYVINSVKMYAPMGIALKNVVKFV